MQTTPKLTPAQQIVLDALRNGATIERRTRPTTVAGTPCTKDLGRFLVSQGSAATRLNDNTDILPALIIWSDEMKASDPEWRVYGTARTSKYTDQDRQRERGAYIQPLARLVEMSLGFKAQDHADYVYLDLRFPNGQRVTVRNGRGTGFNTEFRA